MRTPASIPKQLSVSLLLLALLPLGCGGSVEEGSAEETAASAVSEALDEALGVVSRDYDDFAYEFVYRDADHVRASFEGLRQSLLIGGALAVLVLFVFLGDLRSPVVVGLAIPVSIVITFGLLFFGDVKLNLMSLGGLSLAAGMLVDNSIVVLENIHRHLSRGRSNADPDSDSDSGTADAGSPLQVSEARRKVALAAHRGTREVARPVVAATLTTSAVFFPVVYVPGIAGAFFRDQALTVTFSLLISIGAALLLQPVLSVRLLRARRGKPRGLFTFFHWGLEKLHDLYHPLLVRVLRVPLPFVALVVAGLAGAGVWAWHLDRSFLPERSLGDVRLDLELPAGTPLEQTAAGVAELAAWIERQDGVRAVFSQVGRTERTLAAVQDTTTPDTARVRIILEPVAAPSSAVRSCAGASPAGSVRAPRSTSPSVRRASAWARSWAPAAPTSASECWLRIRVSR